MVKIKLLGFKLNISAIIVIVMINTNILVVFAFYIVVFTETGT